MTSTAVSSSERDDLRERILRASITLIEEEGLGALSMREVARRAGVSHQAPYHYFEDREAILAQLAQHGFEMLEAAMRKARSPEVSATEALERAAIAYVTFACEHPAHFRIMFRPELVCLKEHESAECAANDAFKHVPEMVIDCVKAGFPQTVSVEVMSTLLWSIVHGFAFLLLDGPLLQKVPGFMEDQPRAIAEVARAARLLVESTIQQELLRQNSESAASTSSTTKH